MKDIVTYNQFIKAFKKTKRGIRGRPIRSKVIFKYPNIQEMDLTKQAACGECYAEIFEINIEKNIPDQLKFYSYIHEMFHCLLPDLKESQILRLESIWGDILWSQCVEKFIKDTKNKCK